MYVAAIDGTAPPRPRTLSPRQAISNLYPVWSRDGRYIAYTSEQNIIGRELWVWDAASGRETRVAVGPFGRAYGWSHDSSQILVSAPGGGGLYAIERATGRSRLVAEGAQRAMWVPAGIVYRSNRKFIMSDPVTLRPLRTFDYRDPSITNLFLAWDGSVMALGRDGRITLRDVATGVAREWQDSGVVSLDGHFMAPHGSGVAYAARRKDLRGDATTLMFWVARASRGNSCARMRPMRSG